MTKLNKLKAKIHPPRLDSEKMAMFATRTPHPPNPIGLSLVKLEKVDALPAAAGVWTDARDVRTLDVRFTASAERDFARHLGVRAANSMEFVWKILTSATVWTAI